MSAHVEPVVLFAKKPDVTRQLFVAHDHVAVLLAAFLLENGLRLAPIIAKRHVPVVLTAQCADITLQLLVCHETVTIDAAALLLELLRGPVPVVMERVVPVVLIARFANVAGEPFLAHSAVTVLRRARTVAPHEAVARALSTESRIVADRVARLEMTALTPQHVVRAVPVAEETFRLVVVMLAADRAVGTCQVSGGHRVVARLLLTLAAAVMTT